MNFPCSSPCDGCVGQYLCRCLRITEEEVVTAIRTFALTTIQEVRRHTGAGDGCTACHQALQAVIEAHAPASSPICSVK